MQDITGFKEQMNTFGSKKEPFVFLIDFLTQEPRIFDFKNSKNEILWRTPRYSNSVPSSAKSSLTKWKLLPVSFEAYLKGFSLIQQHINNGDSYLLNYTQPTLIETNLSIDEIYYLSNSPYKILLKDQFVCFSPEPFIRIANGKISSFPMKGTIEAEIKNAEEIIISNSKELAEHNTIVDLIRNDISIVAGNTKVEKFRYLEKIHTNRKDLWQVSSKITGELPENYTHNLGDIIFNMLPAGSISGAPKKKTVEIISEAENYKRGYYTGIFGVFDGKELDSCVLIRFLENQNGLKVFKSGGGITFMSDAGTEYQEMLKKVYVPVN